MATKIPDSDGKVQQIRLCDQLRSLTGLTLVYGGRDWMPELVRRNSHYTRDSIISVREYTLAALAHPDFKNNPRAFMEQWRKRRGKTEELRIPEDPARVLVTIILASDKHG